jgi:glycerol-3-phosphate dehydrogenase
LGDEILFGTKMTNLIVKDGVVKGVTIQDADGQKIMMHRGAVVLATGHLA